MTQLSDEWIQKLGPPVLPFERKQFRSRIEKGEDIIFLDAIILITNSSYVNPVVTPTSDILIDRPMQGKYLWVVDEQGLKLIPELTPNIYARRKVVCHTNITGGAPALQGGELWFGDDGKVYLNYKSGRYGATIGTQGGPHRLAIVAFFESLGFATVVLADNFN